MVVWRQRQRLFLEIWGEDLHQEAGLEEVGEQAVRTGLVGEEAGLDMEVAEDGAKISLVESGDAVRPHRRMSIGEAEGDHREEGEDVGGGEETTRLRNCIAVVKYHSNLERVCDSEDPDQGGKRTEELEHGDSLPSIQGV